MRILITGGAGCLGSNLIEHWQPQGHDILAMDNFATGPRDALAGIPGLKIVEGSIADRALVEKVFAEFQPTHVVHSAAAYKDPNDWSEDAATNVLGSIHVVEAARRCGVRRFINFQTALCYGQPQVLPIPLDHPCRPIGSYGISKLAGENYVALSGLPYLSIRLASVIAPRLTIGAIPTFYTRLKAGKAVFCTTAIRDFLDVSDFFSFIDLAMAEDAPTGTFNLGPGVGHSIGDVLHAVASVLGVKLPEALDIRPVGDDDVQTVILDPKQAQQAFGWAPKIGFGDAIARMVSWYDANGVSAIHSHLKPVGRA